MDNLAYERQFTSTGEKLFRHPEALKRFRDEGKATPIVMHIMKTSRCNLKCSFCSVKDRKHHEVLSLENEILQTVDKLIPLGLKAVIFSGGGEPTFDKEFEQMVDKIYSRDLEMGLITNGTLLNKYNPNVFEKFEWLRISINSLDYVKDIKLPKLNNPTVGFSYIVTDKDTTPKGTEKIRDLAKESNVSYVRLLPDCAQPLEKLLEKHKEVGEMAKKLGEPFFHQFKIHKSPNSCYLGYFHPVLYCDGYIYPCDSLVLNDFENQQFHSKFRLCKYDQIEKIYNAPLKSLVDPKKMCPNCVFERQNSLLEKVLKGDYNPLPKIGPIKHENFI